MVRSSPTFVQWMKMRPSGSEALDLAAYQKFGVSGDGDGWIWLRSGSQAEQFIGEEDEDVYVISSSLRVLYVKGGCTRCTVLH
ncbi:hypothetical protein SEVIR_2G334550v4 [Setaria viridis]